MELKKLKCVAGFDEEGYTLLEVLMSLGILSVGLLGVVGLFVTSIGGNAQGKSVTEASSLAQARLEILTNAELYGTLDSLDPDDYPAYSNLKADGSAGGKYNVRWTVTDSGIALLGSDLKTITVTVTWTTKGQPHKVELSTLRAKT